MIKMRNGGITIEVWESEVDFYKRAGFEVVKDEPIQSEEVAPAEESDEAPAKKRPAKKE